MTNFHPPKSLIAQQDCPNSSNNLSEGTCKPKTNRVLSTYKNLLGQPCAQSFVVPFPSNCFTWIIVKEAVPDEQPIFHLYFDGLNKRILSAQKQANNIGCNYMISKDQKPKKDEFFVAKVRGNFRNSEFFVYDNGENPKKKCVKKRQQLAYVRVRDDSIFGQSEDQKMQIIVPSVQETEKGDGFRSCPKKMIPNEQKQNLLVEGYELKSASVINLFEQHEVFTLSSEQLWASYFSSVEQEGKKINLKFQMNNALSESPVLSLSSRTKNTYLLKLGYPLNMVQGFGIALALIERADS